MTFAIIQLINNHYAEKVLCSPIFFVFYRIAKCIGLLELVLRAIDNRSRACPPLAGWPGFFGEEGLCQEKRIEPQIQTSFQF